MTRRAVHQPGHRDGQQLTDFDAELNFEPKGYAERLEWLQPYGASALFAAGGTGEFFSLEPTEYSDVIRVEFIVSSALAASAAATIVFGPLVMISPALRPSNPPSI